MTNFIPTHHFLNEKSEKTCFINHNAIDIVRKYAKKIIISLMVSDNVCLVKWICDFFFASMEFKQPFVRLCEIKKLADGSCGFHLSRTQWDPYPWVSDVDDESPAYGAGLCIGDCVLEVNGEDILGLKITEVAQKVRSKSTVVCLLVWNASVLEAEDAEPTAFNLQRFSSYFQSVVQLLECPVCLELTSFPTYQCINGHIICGDCRARTPKCPICRAFLSGRGRCLLAEKLHFLLMTTFSSKKKSQSKTSLSKCKIFHQNRLRISGSSDKNVLKFICPWSGKCDKTANDESELFSHLQEHLSGPFIHYFLKSNVITIQLSESGLIYLEDEFKNIFFLQIIDKNKFWLSILADEAKASEYKFKVENKIMAVNSLITPRKFILDKELYVLLASGVKEVTLEIIKRNLVER